MTPQYHEVSAEAFIELLSLNDRNVSGVEVKEQVVIDRSNFPKRRIVEIHHCKLDSLIIDGAKTDMQACLETNLNLYDCDIGILHISNLQLNSLRLDNCPRIGRLWLVESYFKNIYYFKINTDLLDILYCAAEKSTIGTCIIRELQIDGFNTEALSLNEIRSEKLSLKDCGSHVSITESKLGILKFEVLKRQVESFFLEGSTATKVIFNNPMARIESISMFHSAFAEIEFINVTVRALRLEDITSSVIFFSRSFDNFRIFHSKIGELNLNDLRLEKGILRIDSSKIDTLNLQRVVKSDGAELSLNHVEIADKLLIDQGYFPRAHFNDIDLTRATAHLESTILTGSHLINVRWNRYRILERRKNDFSSFKERIDYYWNLKEQYRQLKVLSMSQSNKIDAINFQRQELRTYLKVLTILTWRSGMLNLYRYLADWLVLSTNRVFSNFGQSWIVPLLWWFLIHGMLFGFMLEHFPIGVKFNLANVDYEATCRASKLFVELLFPVHNRVVHNVYTGQAVDIWGFLDFGMRMVSPYFIYYFIRGTRKYNLAL